MAVEIVQSERNAGQELLKSAVSGTLEKVKQLIADGADVHVLTKKSSTVLHGAALGGNLEVFKYFIEHEPSFGLDVSAANIDGHTVLHLAVINGKLDIVKYLLEHKKIFPLNVSARDKEGTTLSDIAEEKKHAAKDLNEKNNYESIQKHIGAYKQRLNEYLVEFVVEDSAKKDIEKVDVKKVKEIIACGATDFVSAAGAAIKSDKCSQIVEFLYEQHFSHDVNMAKNLLQAAIENKCWENVSVLLNNASFEVKKELLVVVKNELFAAINANNLDVVQKILASSDDEEIHNAEGLKQFLHSKLMYAVDAGTIKKLLHSVGDDVVGVAGQAIEANNADVLDAVFWPAIEKTKNITWMMVAAAGGGSGNIIEYLLDKEETAPLLQGYAADWYNAKQKALMSAVQRGHADIVDSLLKRLGVHGVLSNDVIDINKRIDSDGRTLLSIAAEYGHLAIVKRLFAAGADPSATDEYGRSPLYYAIKGNKLDVVKEVLEHNTPIGHGEIAVLQITGIDKNIIDQVLAKCSPDLRDGVLRDLTPKEKSASEKAGVLNDAKEKLEGKKEPSFFDEDFWESSEVFAANETNFENTQKVAKTATDMGIKAAKRELEGVDKEIENGKITTKEEITKGTVKEFVPTKVDGHDAVGKGAELPAVKNEIKWKKAISVLISLVKKLFNEFRRIFQEKLSLNKKGIDVINERQDAKENPKKSPSTVRGLMQVLADKSVRAEEVVSKTAAEVSAPSPNLGDSVATKQAKRSFSQKA